MDGLLAALITSLFTTPLLNDRKKLIQRRTKKREHGVFSLKLARKGLQVFYDWKRERKLRRQQRIGDDVFDYAATCASLLLR